MAKTNSALAFENGFDESPDTLYRVHALRVIGGKKVRSSNWFTSREAADAHSDRITKKGDEVIGVREYRAVL
mgnify:CR=1 FL=1